jgi:hypothetical protein
VFELVGHDKLKNMKQNWVLLNDIQS